MNGTPPSDSFSAVEKNCTYVGYCAMVLQMTCASRTRGTSPARCALIAAASPHGPPPTIRTSQSDDLVTTRPDTHVRDRGLHHRLHAVQVTARGIRQILDAPRGARRLL